MILNCADDSLGHGVGVVELGFVAGGADVDGLAGSEEFLPGQGGGLATQFVEGNGLKLAKPHQHPAGRARPQVDFVEMAEEAFKLHAARHGARVVDAEREQFGAGEVFEAGWGDGEEGEAATTCHL